MRIIRWLGLGLAILIALLFVTAFVTRFADGPVGPFPGGPLVSGELGPSEGIDWSALAEVGEVEFALVDPPRSRTTWIVVHDGQGYIPCGFPEIRLLKQWPHEVLQDGRVVLRVEGRRYELQATRVDDIALVKALGGIASKKYQIGGEGETDPDSVWFFRLDPRPGPPSG